MHLPPTDGSELYFTMVEGKVEEDTSKIARNAMGSAYSTIFKILVDFISKYTSLQSTSISRVLCPWWAASSMDNPEKLMCS